ARERLARPSQIVPLLAHSLIISTPTAGSPLILEVYMDDTPKHFMQELRSSILRKRAGQIAVAVVLAEACLRLLNALTWFLVIPAIANVLNGHSESVLFQTRRQIPIEQLLGSVL